MSDAVRRHPNLIEVFVNFCNALTALGVVKGVLQRADVQKVDAMDNIEFFIDSQADVMSCECECILASLFLQWVMYLVCLHLFSYQGGLGPRVPHTCNEKGVTKSSACSVGKVL